MKRKFFRQALTVTIILVVLVTVVGLPPLKAQNQLLDECAAINKAYRNARQLSFDIKYAYSKAANPGLITDSAIASYRMDGSNYRFKMEDSEFMQNDSFRIAVMGPERVINVGKSRAGSQVSLPMDQWDSLFRNNDFTYTLEKEGENKKFTVTYNRNTTSFFKKMEVWYEPLNYRVKRVTYTVDESVFDPGWIEEGIVSGDLMMVDISFTNYQTGRFTSDTFSSANYFNKLEKEYIPATAYAGFEVFINSPELSLYGK